MGETKVRGSYGVELAFFHQTVGWGSRVVLTHTDTVYSVSIARGIPKRVAKAIFSSMMQIPHGQRVFDAIAVVRDNGEKIVSWRRTR